jgi:hypothetical protein
MATTIYPTRQAALDSFAVHNPQPEGGRVQVDNEWTEYVWGLDAATLFTQPGGIFARRCRTAEGLRDGVASPDSRAVPVPVGAIHIQTSYPDGQDFQSATMYYRM